MTVIAEADPRRPPLAAPTYADSNAYRLAARQLAGGVCLVTRGEGEAWVGLTTTSVASLSVDPPTLVACIGRASSLYSGLARGALFAISVLAADQSESPTNSPPASGWTAPNGSAKDDGRRRPAASRRRRTRWRRSSAKPKN